MPKPTDIRVIDAELYFIPIQTRVPLKFGSETLNSVTCARVKVSVRNSLGKEAVGWGETPLSVQWVWPSSLPHEVRHSTLKNFTQLLVKHFQQNSTGVGHAMEIGHDFLNSSLPSLLTEFNNATPGREPMPWLAALVCCSAIDLAIHDGYGVVNEIPIYKTYNESFMNRDLAEYFGEESRSLLKSRYPEHYLRPEARTRLEAWHLVGGKDPIGPEELTGTEPNDGYPILLRDWIKKDGLKCLKIKLRGNDWEWDYQRLLQVGHISVAEGVLWLTADFNCTVTDPSYVNAILDKLQMEQPRYYGMLLYVEQPFPYDLEKHQIDVHSVAARKPLFMDESAHDWQMLRLGRTLGWTGVALKTCKTQTGALLSLCWGQAHGMTLMVQDLTNPMLAQIPHVQLAANAFTIMGVETNSMQFYPEASLPEAAVHSGLYQRRGGELNLSTIQGPGFGYCLENIARQLPVRVI